MFSTSSFLLCLLTGGVIRKPSGLPRAGSALLLLHPQPILVAGKDQPYKITEASLNANLQHIDIPLKT